MMNAAVLAVVVLALFALGYRFYSRFLAERVFGLRRDEPVPSRQYGDGVDYVPTRMHVLWGHHYTSIAGAAPIVGPALAVIWGWVPALLWVTIGTLSMGAVHDFSALVISLRHRGRSIGDIAGMVIGPRARTLFLIIISFLIWVVLAVFAYIIGTLFISYPASVFPINIQIVVAVVLGWLVYRGGWSIVGPSIVGYLILLTAVFYGESFAAAVPAVAKISVGTWVWLLMIYSFVASVLPVWLLLQPRDYLNAHQLLTGLLLLTAGLIVLHPTVQAPAFNPSPEGAPPLLPFLFITIACGAISGFHGLVASGTTSKQIACMTDSRPIGYGGMLGEGALGMMAVLATTAGFATSSEWLTHYASWGAASGLGPKLEAFVNGGGRFIAALGVPLETAQTFVAVMVIAFAATSLDTGARIQRLIIAELAGAYGIKPLTNRYAAGAVGIGAALVLALTQAGGKGGLILWPLFGTTNQLVAGVTLLVVSVWLRRAGRPILYTMVPMFVVALATLMAMVGEVRGHIVTGNWLLAGTGGAILILDLWVLLEGLSAMRGRPGQGAVRLEAGDAGL
jgi:carbon starvation protein